MKGNILIDRPSTTVEVEGERFTGQSIEIITTPESAGASIKYCHFSGFRDGPAITVKGMGSYLGRFLFPTPPVVSIQHCYFNGQ